MWARKLLKLQLKLARWRYFDCININFFLCLYRHSLKFKPPDCLAATFGLKLCSLIISLKFDINRGMFAKRIKKKELY